jgi:hypothetical protein
VFPVDFDGGEHVYRVHPINIQLVTCLVIMPAKEELGWDSGSENLDKHEPRDILHCHVEQCVYVSNRFGGESVMVWAGIFHGGRTQLKIVQGTLDAVKYREDILDPTVLSFLQQRNFDHVFQHDNARCHRTF